MTSIHNITSPPSRRRRLTATAAALALGGGIVVGMANPAAASVCGFHDNPGGRPIQIICNDLPPFEHWEHDNVAWLSEGRQIFTQAEQLVVPGMFDGAQLIVQSVTQDEPRLRRQLEQTGLAKLRDAATVLVDHDRTVFVESPSGEASGPVATAFVESMALMEASVQASDPRTVQHDEQQAMEILQSAIGDTLNSQ